MEAREVEAEEQAAGKSGKGVRGGGEGSAAAGGTERKATRAMGVEGQRDGRTEAPTRVLQR